LGLEKKIDQEKWYKKEKHELNYDHQFTKVVGSCCNLEKWNDGIRRWRTSYISRNDVIFYT